MLQNLKWLQAEVDANWRTTSALQLSPKASPWRGKHRLLEFCWKVWTGAMTGHRGQKAQQIWLFKTVLMMIMVSAFLYGWVFLQVRIHQQAINCNLPRWHECVCVSRNDRFSCFLTWHRLTECETNYRYPSCLQLRSVCNSKRVNIYGSLRLPTVKQLTLTLRLWMLHGRPESPKLKAFVMRFPLRWSWYVSGASKRGFHESTARASTSSKERPMASKQ